MRTIRVITLPGLPEYIALGRDVVATNSRPRARLPKDRGNYPCHRALVSHIEKYGLIDLARRLNGPKQTEQ
jgi:hypothetical protein